MSGNIRHIINMANSIVGVSILSMPYCFKETGLVLGIVLILLSGFITKQTCMFLIRSAIMARRRSLEFLAFHVFGMTGKLFVEVCMILFLFGICISFHVVIGDLAPAIVARHMDVENTWSLRATILVGIVMFVILPLCLLRNIDSLASMSAASIGFYLVLLGVTFYAALPRLIDGSWYAAADMWHWERAFHVLPIMTLGLACQSNVFEIYDSIPDPDVVKMRTVVCQAVNLCCALYIGVGFLGYVAFVGTDFGGNIILSFPSSALTEAIKIFFVVSLAISFPLMLFPCRTSIHSLLYRRNTQMSYDLVGNYMPEARFKAITVSVLIVSLIIGIIMSNIAFVLGLLGSTMGMLIALILPSIFIIKLNAKASFERLFAQSILLLGLFMMILGTYLHIVNSGDVEVFNVDDNNNNNNEIKLSSPLIKLPKLSEELKKLDIKALKSEVDVKVRSVDGEDKLKSLVDDKDLATRKEPVIPEPPREDQLKLLQTKKVEPPIVQRKAVVPPLVQRKAVEPPLPQVKAVEQPLSEAKIVAGGVLEGKSELMKSELKIEVLHPDAIKKEEKENAEELVGQVVDNNKDNDNAANSQVKILKQLEVQQVAIIEQQKKIMQQLEEQNIKGDEIRKKEQQQQQQSMEAKEQQQNMEANEQQQQQQQSMEAKEQQQQQNMEANEQQQQNMEANEQQQQPQPQQQQQQSMEVDNKESPYDHPAEQLNQIDNNKLPDIPLQVNNNLIQNQLSPEINKVVNLVEINNNNNKLNKVALPVDHSINHNYNHRGGSQADPIKDQNERKYEHRIIKPIINQDNQINLPALNNLIIPPYKAISEASHLADNGQHKRLINQSPINNNNNPSNDNIVAPLNNDQQQQQQQFVKPLASEAAIVNNNNNNNNIKDTKLQGDQKIPIVAKSDQLIHSLPNNSAKKVQEVGNVVPKKQMSDNKHDEERRKRDVVNVIQHPHISVPNIGSNIKGIDSIVKNGKLFDVGDIAYDTRHLLWTGRRRKKRRRNPDQEYWDEM